VADPIKDKPVENIFRIMDEIVHHLNRTKKMIILMIISIIIVLPATHIITFALIGDTIFDGGERPRFDRSGGPPDSPAFRIVQAVVIGTILFWLGVGIRQWFVLSKWTKKYKQYKQLQKKIDEKLDYDSDPNKGNEGQQEGKGT
jgi:NADH:ubiquinone oxidoreductase subunit 5 (subunit L)/multisubunit Na+/H+ antiporter MnhA subunit